MFFLTASRQTTSGLRRYTSEPRIFPAALWSFGDEGFEDRVHK
jgi:hypothetical protein